MYHVFTYWAVCIVSDCVHVQLYRDSKERYNNGQTKASLSLQHFLAVQSGNAHKLL